MFLSLTESSLISPYFSLLEFDPRWLFLYNISGWINPLWGFLVVLWTYSQQVNLKTSFVYKWYISPRVGKKNTEIAFKCMKFCKKNCQDTYFFFFIQNCMEIRVFKYTLLLITNSLWLIDWRMNRSVDWLIYQQKINLQIDLLYAGRSVNLFFD